MIPADGILIDGGTAWWIPPNGPEPSNDWPGWDEWDPETGSFWSTLDQPCAACRGSGLIRFPRMEWAGKRNHCTACQCTGRHTFDIEVRASGPLPCERHDQCDCTCYNGLPHCKMGCGFDDVLSWPTTTHRVSVVPGMVLPIFEWCPDDKPADHICDAYGEGRWIHHSSGGPFDETETLIVLPSAAAPGMYAVKLRVQSSSVTN